MESRVPSDWAWVGGLISAVFLAFKFARDYLKGEVKSETDPIKAEVTQLRENMAACHRNILAAIVLLPPGSDEPIRLLKAAADDLVRLRAA